VKCSVTSFPHSLPASGRRGNHPDGAQFLARLGGTSSRTTPSSGRIDSPGARNGCIEAPLDSTTAQTSSNFCKEFISRFFAKNPQVVISGDEQHFLETADSW